ncbi:DUF2577 family protein [Fusobacterium necrophorum]|uniref:DUF2577 family protein n=1 Tax=Fusobacterium necrophorum TaxID=859 RepID=UPI0007888673|nr:DUF2577 family protein [Fusobacterium necrophorum]KYM50890.1 hypothetical protein A2U04_00680 [Fusobacterium necrophorum subsp. funduliforme]
MNQLIDLIIENTNRSTSKTLIVAKVISPPPALKLKFAEQEIMPEQIYCSNYLLPHYHRDYKIDGVIGEIKIDVDSYDYTNTTSDLSGDKIIPLQGSGKFEGSGTYKSHKDIWFEDTLKAGDEVLVAIVGVFYVVISKITKMPNKAIEGV